MSVLVVMENRGREWNRLSWEALACGRQLADAFEQPLFAAAVGVDLEAASRELTGKKIDRLYAVEHPLLAQYTVDGFTIALAQLIRDVNPTYVVFPHTYQVRDYAPRLATRFGESLIADLIGLRVTVDGPVFVRQLMQGKVNADYRHCGSGPCFVSVQAGAFPADSLPSGQADVEVFRPQLEASQIRTKPEEPFREAAQTVDLNSANLIVAVGRGIKEKENLPVVEELATALGAELAASRPICDNGWLPMQRQVGSSGQTVSPKLYFAIGISGAIQHLVGMKGSKTIVAVNKDDNAPIFEVADYAIVGDLFEIVPAITAAVNNAKNKTATQ